MRENAGGRAVVCAVNHTARRVGCVAGDPRQFQRCAVGNTVVAHGVGKPGGVLAGNRIDIGGIEVTALLEFAFVPAAPEDPVPWLDNRHPLTDPSANVADVPHVRKA